MGASVERAKVTKIHETEATKLLHQFSEKCYRGEVSELIFMAIEKDGIMTSHWFGDDSSIKCLGMAQYMANRISKYIEEG